MKKKLYIFLKYLRNKNWFEINAKIRIFKQIETKKKIVKFW